ncbi:non-heme iron oxygenase ferredoxin subunit [Leekyejoonella antrihumi]|uniref:Non-heme iron oxygenase ferredoxin subunit n=1 Tax=Leekyejoonella antrihumi TaxID=1660198 RepID=A0A563E4M1_9MICO|nr:non-heme iron oxygenase ferredoxin subunit [Leekyejoonella antrihumi]TWP37182.1 non-heme iron oxygenase ferredoxin subunit [Leekyejoonella antrihumi]
MSEQTSTEEFVRVCTLDELPQVGAACAEINGKRVCIARDSAGDVHAIDDTCSHANVSLSEGDIDGHTIECWLHGSRFDLRSGEPTGLPATEPVAVYPVKIDGDDVYVAVPN